jgi:hypothetical protein
VEVKEGHFTFFPPVDLVLKGGGKFFSSKWAMADIKRSVFLSRFQKYKTYLSTGTKRCKTQVIPEKLLFARKKWLRP